MQPPINTPPPADPKALWAHFSDTYFSLRIGLAGLAFAFPLVLWGYGKLRHGLDLQPSMSAYFWAAATLEQCATFPMRTIFVGFLFAIGVGLYLYKGMTNLENYLLNVAGICAAVVAVFPEYIATDDTAKDPRIAELFTTCPAVKVWAAASEPFVHFTAAVLLFVLLWAVARFCAGKTLDYLPSDQDAAAFRRRYRLLGWAMLLFWIPALLVAFVLGLWGHKVFFIEAAGVWTFGLYWAVKSRELSLSRLEEKPHEAVDRALRSATAPRGG